MVYNNFWNYAGYGAGSWMSSWIGFFLLPLVLWSLFWKGLALWRAAKNNSTVWFIILLVLNTAGIVEILYLIFTSLREKLPKKHLNHALNLKENNLEI
jgi:methionyl-tRNA synthetase